MQRKVSLGALSLPLLALLGAIAGVSAARPGRELSGTATNYVVAIFGDSISDNGNTFRAAGVPDPAYYYKGRYSNYLNWVDYLNDTMATKNVKIVNYAYGGATACASPQIEAFAPFVKNLTGQTQLFLGDLAAGKLTLQSGASRLLIIQWIGSNDIVMSLRTALASGQFPDAAAVAGLASSMVACRLASIQAIAAATQGRLPIDVAFVPVSPAWASPEVPAFLKPQVKVLIDAVGTITFKAVEQLRKAFGRAKPGQPGYGIKLYSMGVNSDWISSAARQVRPKFKYTEDAACIPGDFSTLVLNPGLSVCSHPEEYQFYDTVHPTTLYYKAFLLKGLLPRLQEKSLLPK